MLSVIKYRQVVIFNFNEKYFCILKTLCKYWYVQRIVQFITNNIGYQEITTDLRRWGTNKFWELGDKLHFHPNVRFTNSKAKHRWGFLVLLFKKKTFQKIMVFPGAAEILLASMHPIFPKKPFIFFKSRTRANHPATIFFSQQCSSRNFHQG